MAETGILDGIIIGTVGGGIAGVMVPFSTWLVSLYRTRCDKRLVYDWLQQNTADRGKERFRSTRAIASYNNLTQDRVRYICSIHPEIFLSTGEKDDMWGTYAHNPDRRRTLGKT